MSWQVLNRVSEIRATNIKMNVFEDAFRFFTNMNKEASAKHILIKGKGASEKLSIIKEELLNASNITASFSELAQKERVIACEITKKFIIYFVVYLMHRSASVHQLQEEETWGLSNLG